MTWRRCAFVAVAATATSVGAQTRAGEVDVGDARIHYELTGSGKTIVLVHGWANTLHIWDNQVALLSKEFAVLRYDRRGFGRSTGFADISADAEDLRILLDALRITSAYMVGLSAGADVASRFAFKYPSRVDALVRVSGPPPEGFPMEGSRPRSMERRRTVAGADLARERRSRSTDSASRGGLAGPQDPRGGESENCRGWTCAAHGSPRGILESDRGLLPQRGDRTLTSPGWQ